MPNMESRRVGGRVWISFYCGVSQDLAETVQTTESDTGKVLLKFLHLFLQLFHLPLQMPVLTGQCVVRFFVCFLLFLHLFLLLLENLKSLDYLFEIAAKISVLLLLRNDHSLQGLDLFEV